MSANREKVQQVTLTLNYNVMSLTKYYNKQSASVIIKIVKLKVHLLQNAWAYLIKLINQNNYSLLN